jgi:hypothetical protein
MKVQISSHISIYYSGPTREHPNLLQNIHRTPSNTYDTNGCVSFFVIFG